MKIRGLYFGRMKKAEMHILLGAAEIFQAKAWLAQYHRKTSIHCRADAGAALPCLPGIARTGTLYHLSIAKWISLKNLPMRHALSPQKNNAQQLEKTLTC
jgi:hypothetical protein